MKSPLRILALLGLAAYAALALLPLALASVLLFTAETLAGYVFAIDALLLLALPVSLARGLLRRDGKPRFLLVGGNAVLAAAFYLLLLILSPPGRSLPGSGIATHYPEKPYPRSSIANLLPEIDQVKLGTFFVSLVDPRLDRRAAAHVREVSLEVYRPLEKDAAFRALGSSMHYAYLDRDSGHFYEYVPPHSPEENLPAVVFLHGSGGNFKAYLYLWRKMADAGRFMVVAPSFGFGRWDEPGGLAAIEKARLHALGRLEADPRRIFLAGLSNGGIGVGLALAQTPPRERRWAGVILLSAVGPYVRDELAIAEACQGLPVLFVHGEKDDRVPWTDQESFVAALRAGGADVTVRLDPSEDHFLLFSKESEVEGWVNEWMKVQLSARRD
jgi:predicted esterase